MYTHGIVNLADRRARRERLERNRELMPLPEKGALRGTDFIHVPEQALRILLLRATWYSPSFIAVTLDVNDDSVKYMTKSGRPQLGRAHYEAYQALLAAAPELTIDWDPAFRVFGPTFPGAA